MVDFQLLLILEIELMPLGSVVFYSRSKIMFFCVCFSLQITNAIIVTPLVQWVFSVLLLLSVVKVFLCMPLCEIIFNIHDFLLLKEKEWGTGVSVYGWIIRLYLLCACVPYVLIKSYQPFKFHLLVAFSLILSSCGPLSLTSSFNFHTEVNHR